MSRCVQRLLIRHSFRAVLLLALALGLSVPSACWAQPDEDPAASKPASRFLEIEGKPSRAETANAKEIWQSEDAMQGARKKRFDDYYFQKYLPQMTQAFMWDSLPEFREELDKQFRSRSGNSEHVNMLNQIVATFAYGVARGGRRARLKNGKIVDVYWLGPRLFTMKNKDVTDAVDRLAPAKKDFHPAVRYNAMLLLGMLDSSKAKVQSIRGERFIAKPATPYARAFTPMLDLAIGRPYQPTRESFAKTESGPAPDAVRIAALLGLKRHLVANPDRNETEKNLIVGEMLRLAKTKPPGFTDVGPTWYRRLALEIIGTVGYAGQSGQVVTQLESILGDESEPIAVRCAAADALGRLVVDNPPEDLNIELLLAKLAQLAADTCREEVALLETPKSRIPAARLMASIECVLVALRGVVSETSEDEPARDDDEDLEIATGLLAWVGEDSQESVKLAIKMVRTLQLGVRQAGNGRLKTSDVTRGADRLQNQFALADSEE